MPLSNRGTISYKISIQVVDLLISISVVNHSVKVFLTQVGLHIFPNIQKELYLLWNIDTMVNPYLLEMIP
jgi:hypothetical protein